MQCEAHVGFVFTDGPAPLGLRFQVNSGAVNFHKKEWFEMSRVTPEYSRKVRKEQAVSRNGNEQFAVLLADEQMLGLGTYKDRRQAMAD